MSITQHFKTALGGFPGIGARGVSAALNRAYTAAGLDAPAADNYDAILAAGDALVGGPAPALTSLDESDPEGYETAIAEALQAIAARDAWTKLRADLARGRDEATVAKFNAERETHAEALAPAATKAIGALKAATRKLDKAGVTDPLDAEKIVAKRASTADYGRIVDALSTLGGIAALDERITAGLGGGPVKPVAPILRFLQFDDPGKDVLWVSREGTPVLVGRRGYPAVFGAFHDMSKALEKQGYDRVLVDVARGAYEGISLAYSFGEERAEQRRRYGIISTPVAMTGHDYKRVTGEEPRTFADLDKVMRLDRMPDAATWEFMQGE